jgi:hypothetical protein
VVVVVVSLSEMAVVVVVVLGSLVVVVVVVVVLAVDVVCVVLVVFKEVVVGVVDVELIDLTVMFLLRSKVLRCNESNSGSTALVFKT